VQLQVALLPVVATGTTIAVSSGDFVAFVRNDGSNVAGPVTVYSAGPAMTAPFWVPAPTVRLLLTSNANVRSFAIVSALS
jgi:hypothetical protein